MVALQNAINDAIKTIPPATANGGGTVVIPAGIYELGGTVSPPMTATITIAGVTGGLTIRGESAGTTLVQYGTPGTGQNVAADIFDVSNSASPAQVSILFHEITFQYANNLQPPSSGEAFAINCMTNAAYVTAEQCGFYKCMQAFSAGPGMGGLRCGLVHCQILQDPNGYPSSTQVVLSAPEAFVESCEFFIMGDPIGTAISVKSGAENCHVEGCHITGFGTAIEILDGAVFTRISNCKIDALNGVTIAPANKGGTIYGVFVTACSIGMLENTKATSTTWGIYIDTAQGSSIKVEGICIDGCVVYGYQDAGLQINEGKSISVIGGKYSSNGQHPTLTELGAGIAITGACEDVRIVGADCSGVFDFWPTVTSGYPAVTQPYGISVASGVTGVIVSDCNLTNAATAALSVPTNGTDLRVTNCVGYNDIETLVTNTVPTSGIPFTAATYGYYGPVTFYVNGGTGVSIFIDTYFTGLASGSFTLNAEHKAMIEHLTNPTFVMLGQ